MQQISCRGKEGRKGSSSRGGGDLKKDMREEETNRLKTNAQRVQKSVTMMLNFNPVEVMMLLVGPQLQMRRK